MALVIAIVAVVALVVAAAVSWRLSPPAGVPRVYHGATVPVIYPGETATATIDARAMFDAIEAAIATGQTEIHGEALATGWTVEGGPGRMARARRVWFRVVAWWLWPIYERLTGRTIPPRLTATANLHAQKEEEH